jgi:dephospho-CoA kinase
LIIAVTGGIGSGKSEFCKVLGELGAGVTVGDELGRRALTTDPRLLSDLRNRFGDQVFDTDGNLIRKALGDIVFSNPKARKWLDARIFPEIYRLLWEDILKLQRDHQHVVIDAAMIFEWGIDTDFDLIVAVVAPPERVKAFLSHRDSFDERQMENRFTSQIPPEEKARRAHVVIHNDGTLADLRLKAHDFWNTCVLSSRFPGGNQSASGG